MMDLIWRLEQTARIESLEREVILLKGTIRRLRMQLSECESSQNLNAVKRASILEAVEQNCPLFNGDDSDLSSFNDGYNAALSGLSLYANERYPDKE